MVQDVYGGIPGGRLSQLLLRLVVEQNLDGVYLHRLALYQELHGLFKVARVYAQVSNEVVT